MAIFEYVSARGDRLSLTGGQNYRLVNIDGQSTAATNISSVVVGGSDGDTVNNIQAQPRTIIIDLRIIANVEETKREILNVIKLKQKGKLYWTQNERQLVIEGVVEAVEMPRWTEATLMQITFHCEQPFWENIDYIISEITAANSLHYFTDIANDMLYFTDEGQAFGIYDTTRIKDIHNAGDVAVGLEIEIVALAETTNPIIYNQDGKFFGCGYGSGNKQLVMEPGDIIKIKTGKDEKEVTFNNRSILGQIRPRSTWIQLEAGSNQFSINSDDESIDNMAFSLKYKQRYI